MMKVVFRLRIHEHMSSASSNDAIVRRECALPFAPFPGLSILFDDDEEIVIPHKWDGDDAETLGYGALSYDLSTDIFTVWLENKERYNAEANYRRDNAGKPGYRYGGFSARDLNEIVKEYTDAGWILEERDLGVRVK